MTRIAALFCLLVVSTEARAELACTNDNGTRIVFVNGVNTAEREAVETRRKISDLFIKHKDKKLLDRNGKVIFDNVYNESDGFWNDIVELRNQVLYDLKGKDQIQFYVEDVLLKNMNFIYQNPTYANSDASKASVVLHNSLLLAQSEKLRMALLDLSKKTNGQFGSDYDDYLRKSRIIKKDFQFQYESILRRAYYDSRTVDKVSTRMTSILTGKLDPNKIGEVFKKSKLIMVPHSAGNQVVKSAYDRVFHYSDETYMKNLEKEESKRYLGVLNMASPSSTSTLGCLRENGVNENCKNEAIKLGFDFVIQASNYIAQPRDEYSMAPNFNLDKSKTATTFIFRTFEGVANIFNTDLPTVISFVSSLPSGATLHGMNEVYLSEYVYATEKNSNTSEKMKDAFIRKLASVAESLPSNCGAPLAKITGPAPKTYYPRDTLTFSAEGSFAYESMPNADEEPTYHWSAISNITGELIAGTGKKFSFPAPPVSQPFTMSLVVVNKAGYSSGKTVLIESKPLPFTADLFSYRVESLDENNIRIHTTADCDSGQIVMVLDVYDHRTAYSFPLCSGYEVGTKNKYVDYPFGVKTKVDLFYFHRNYDPKVFFDW